MTSIPSGSRKQAARRRPSWREISTWLVRAWQGFMKRSLLSRQIRRDVKALSTLDDDQLEDIGLARGEIELVVAERARQSLPEPRPLHRSRLAPSATTPAPQPCRSAS